MRKRKTNNQPKELTLLLGEMIKRGLIVKKTRKRKALPYLMAIDDKVTNSNSTQSNDDMDDLYSGLYVYLIKAKKGLNLLKKIITSLENDLKKL